MKVISIDKKFNKIPGDKLTESEIPNIEELERKFLRQLNQKSGIAVITIVENILMEIELLFTGAFCAILKLSPDQCLCHYSAPSIPKEDILLITGEKMAFSDELIGTAIDFKKLLVIRDIVTDRRFNSYETESLKCGLCSWWSVPVVTSSGSVFGIFAIFGRYPGIPSDKMLGTMCKLADLFGLVIENREMIDELRFLRERNDLSSRATHDMVWDWDLKKNEIFRNEGGLRNIYGFDTNEPIRHIDDWVDRIHPEDRKKVKQHIDAIILGGKESRFEVEYRFLRGDEKYVFIHDRGYIMRDLAGDVIRVIGAAQDISERINVQHLLQESEKNYRSMFESNPVSMLIVDPETNRILEVNEMAIQHYEYSQEEFCSMTTGDLLDLADLEMQDPSMGKGSEILASLQGKARHKKKSGELIFVELLSNRLNYKGKDATLMLVKDVTQNILLQLELIEEKSIRERELVKATIEAQERERKEIGYELHDNVNQLLSSAKLNFECVGLYDNKKEKYRSTGLVLLMEALQEIRNISKALAPPRLDDVGLVKTLGDLLDNLEMVSNFQIDFFHDSFAEERIDENMKLTIYRIAQEQLINIGKHADASRVTIELLISGGDLFFSIGDNGKGYDLAQPGKGIGLSNIVNRAGLHMGKVTIETERYKGFILNVVFPLKG